MGMQKTAECNQNYHLQILNKSLNWCKIIYNLSIRSHVFEPRLADELIFPVIPKTNILNMRMRQTTD